MASNFYNLTKEERDDFLNKSIGIIDILELYFQY